MGRRKHGETGSKKRTDNVAKREPQVDQTDKHNTNRPKNYFITNATESFEFTFCQFASPISVTVHQTPNEELWPGGALWDLGVLLAKVLVLLTSNATLTNQKSQTSCHLDHLYKAIPHIQWKNNIVLELGCGVGLTGLVAAALQAKLVVLTDLEVVVSGITQRNVEANRKKNVNNVRAMPLCWGNEEDEKAVATVLEQQSRGIKSKQKRRVFPDLILIGDVAYQHKPGAPCHFDALTSTLLKFVGPQTMVIFGTRMRMPASVDLLISFKQHLDEVVLLQAHEIDASFQNLSKHNMTVHFFRPKATRITVESK